MTLAERVRYADFHPRIMSAEAAAALIAAGTTVGMSGFTGAGYPKALPQAIAARAKAEHAAGRPYKINLWTGASTAAECDGVLAEAHALGQRLPFNTDPIARQAINAGEIDFIDMHLSHVAQHAWFGFLGPMHVAVIEVLGVTADGLLIPSTAVGNNKTWLEIADKVILEVNTKTPSRMEGMHDIYYGTAIPPRRMPIAMTHADDRIGEAYLKVDPNKVIAIVETHKSDRDNVFAAPDANSNLIAASIID
ncbi:MAG: propionyl-CoA--succinate CoA transferase, partial [Comamonadaceae bacterium]